MRRAFVIGSAAGLIGAFLLAETALGHHTPRQLPWPTGAQESISGYAYNCGTHTRGTATSSGAWNANYYAIDFGLGFGYEVRSVAVGQVVLKGFNSGYGNRIVIDHGNGIHSVYAHFGTPTPGTGFAAEIVEGKWVPQDTLLGYAGYSGQVDPPGIQGTHLHFHMQINLSAYNPEPMSGYTGFGNYGECGSSSPLFTSSQADIDGDEYPDNHENYYGTRPAFDCPFTSLTNDEPIDNWPPDFNDDQNVTLPDLLAAYSNQIGLSVPPASSRIDLVIDGKIMLNDALSTGPYFLTSCN